MKNLKRILSLALASVMVMGMMVVGASAADFEDQDQIDPAFTEATAVLKALKVMQGNDDGTLDPKGELNRAQAATLLSILLNKGKAPNIGVPTNPIFTDVRGTANNWAEKYINYCYNLGAVNGTSTNPMTYSPANALTATAWARMILNVLGIKLDSSANWELRTEIQARDPEVDLYNGLDEVITDPSTKAITREQAAQMLFNGMNYAPNSTGSYYLVKESAADDAKILYQGNDPIAALLIQQANTGSKLTQEEDKSGSILQDTFGVKRITTNTDAFGRTTTEYVQNGKAIVTLGGTAKKTYTAAVTSSQIYNDLGLTASKTPTYKVNGVTVTDIDPDKADDQPLVIAKADTKTTIGGNGSLVEVYVSGSTITVVQVDTFAAQVTKVTEAKAATATADAEKASVTLTVMGTGLTEEDAKKVTYETTGYEKGDIVLVTGNFATKGGSGADKDDLTMTVRSMSKAPFVVGTVTSTAADYIRVDGEKYVLSFTNDAEIGTDAGYTYAANASEYSYYLDAAGSIIYAKEGAAAEDNSKYIYVIDVAAKAAEGEGNDLFETTTGKAAVAQAQVLDLETGAVSIKNIAVVKHTDGKYYYANQEGKADTSKEVKNITAGAAAGANANDINDTFCKFVELDNGDIVLVSAVNADKTAVKEITVKQNKAELDGGQANGLKTGYANNTTKVTIYEKDAKGNISSKGYTGIANFPAAGETFKIAAAADGNPATYDVMYKANTKALVTEIIVVRDAVAETSTANYAIYAGVGETGSNGTAYSFYVEGELKSYYAVSTATEDDETKKDVVADETLTAGDVVTLTFTDEKVSKVEAASTDAANQGLTVTVVEPEYFVATKDSAAKVYYFTDGCVTVDAGDDYKTAEIAEGDTITVYVNEKGNAEFIIIAE